MRLQPALTRRAVCQPGGGRLTAAEDRAAAVAKEAAGEASHETTTASDRAGFRRQIHAHHTPSRPLLISTG